MNLALKILIVLAVILAGVSIGTVYYLNRVHMSFNSYYKFRGCQELIAENEIEGICKIKTGANIKIVRYQNKWYSDNDIPPSKYLSF